VTDKPVAPQRAPSVDGMRRRLRGPWLTGAVSAVTLAVSITALASPALMRLLTRDVPRLWSGDWWRALTPLLVQSDGWGQLGFNLLGIAVVGAALERRVARRAWAMTYALAGIGSLALVSLWHPEQTGGGSSDAVAGLVGALAVLLAVDVPTRHHRAHWPAQVYSVFFASYLATLDVGGLWWSIVIGNLSILAVFVARRALTPATLARACCALVCLAGLLMAWQHDGHGTGILTGIAGALIVLTWRRSRTGGQGTTSAAASPA